MHVVAYRAHRFTLRVYGCTAAALRGRNQPYPQSLAEAVRMVYHTEEARTKRLHENKPMASAA
jgi:hypothetical protein